MQGYQFAHLETWSRQGATKSGGEVQRARRNGQRAWTAEEILDEAERVPGASGHVERAQREPTIWAGTCTSFDELRAAHEQACSVRVAFPYTDPKTGKKKTRKRTLRSDTHTLFSAVFSLPVTSREALADAAVMAECMEVLRAAQAFEQRRLEGAGGEFAMAVLHLDEDHVHLHVYGLDRQRGSVNHLHPGRAANDAFRARHGALKQSGTTLGSQAQRVYCDALREWQDDLHREVFADAGLLRLGPRRARLSRAEYLRQMREQEAAAQARDELRSAGALRNTLAAMGTLMDEREDLAEARDREQDEREARLTELAQTVARQADAARSMAADVLRKAAENAAEAERLSSERAELAETRHGLDDRESSLVEREREVGEQRSRNEARERDLDASLAAVEAIGEGLVAWDEADGRETLQAAKGARLSPVWGKLLARMKKAPDAAVAMGRRLAGSLALQRKKAREQGLAEGRAEARAEWAREFSAVRAAAESLAAVHAFARDLIRRLPGRDRDKAAADLQALLKGAARDVALNTMSAAARSRDNGER